MKRLLVVSVGILLVLLGLAGVMLASGRARGLRSRAGAVVDIARAVAGRNLVLGSAQSGQVDLVFLHHSVGNNLIEQGGVRELFTQAGIDFWDQGYNAQGLRDPAGRHTGYAYPVPNDNTDVDGLAVVFGQTERSLPVNTLSGLLQHDVIMVKSCFPNSNIGSEEKLDEMKGQYLQMLEAVDRHPEKLFIFLTSPPLNPAETNAENAARARRMADWLLSTEFIAGRENLAVVDLHALLAENDSDSPEVNMLRVDYRQGADSHPTPAANREIAPLLVEAVVDAIHQYRDNP